MGMNDIKYSNNEIDWEIKPSKCTVCDGCVEYKGNGEYICTSCGNIELDDMGKVRHYIEENGPSKATEISRGTGVEISKINKFLKQGKIEIPDGSGPYIKCERCGCDIRYGRFCPACASKLCNGVRSAFDMGEVPKKKENSGRMHFFGNDRKKS